ncbi:MAG: hypothetical protein FDZ75_03870, partial [Actinobacteria bacterium]
MWARVDGNRTKLAVFVVLFVVGSAILLSSALVLVPGSLLGAVLASSPLWWERMWVIAGVSCLAVLVIGGIASAVQIANAEDWVRNRFAGRVLEAAEEPGLRSAVHDLSLAAGLPVEPSLVVLE